MNADAETPRALVRDKRITRPLRQSTARQSPKFLPHAGIHYIVYKN